MPPDVGRRWKERYGVDILDGIGSTEMLHIFLSNYPGDVRYGTTGKPVPGYDIRLVDDDGNVVKTRGEMGELQVRGPTAAVMYWNNREKTRETFLGEWTRSGDKYVEDEDGYYVYCGRRDDMLKVGGIYVSPFEVEGALCTHPDVLEAAVVAWPDEDELIKPKAFVVLKAADNAGDELARALQEHVRTVLAPYKYPRWIEFRTDLPKTATGKIQRFKLRAEACARSARAEWYELDAKDFVRTHRARDFRARIRRRRHRRHPDQPGRDDPLRGAAARGRGRHQLDRHRADLRQRRVGRDDRPTSGIAAAAAARFHQGAARSRATSTISRARSSAAWSRASSACAPDSGRAAAAAQSHRPQAPASGSRCRRSRCSGPTASPTPSTGSRSRGSSSASGMTAAGDTQACLEVINSGRFDAAQVYYNAINPSAAWRRVPPGWRGGQSFCGILAACFHQNMGVLNIRVWAGGVLASSGSGRMGFS